MLGFGIAVFQIAAEQLSLDESVVRTVSLIVHLRVVYHIIPPFKHLHNFF